MKTQNDAKIEQINVLKLEGQSAFISDKGLPASQ